MELPIYDLNDPGQAFELTRPVTEPARPGAGAAAARGPTPAPELVALVDRAAALILQPLALVSGWGCECWIAPTGLLQQQPVVTASAITSAATFATRICCRPLGQ